MTKTKSLNLSLAIVMLTGASAFAATKPEIDDAAARSFLQIAKTAKADIDYKIIYKPGVRSYLIVAPHGGNIEPGSTELAQAIANNNYGFYVFNGLKRDSSSVFVPSTRFDEPELMRVTKNYSTVIAVHIVPSSDRIIYVGGDYRQIVDKIIKSLADQGFQSAITPRDGSAWNRTNLVNRNTVGGVQIEVSSAVLDDMFRGPSSNERIRQDPNRRTIEFTRFVNAIKSVLGRSDNHPTGVKIHSSDDKADDKDSRKKK